MTTPGFVPKEAPLDVAVGAGEDQGKGKCTSKACNAQRSQIWPHVVILCISVIQMDVLLQFKFGG
jgi:hypothetical protein